MHHSLHQTYYLFIQNQPSQGNDLLKTIGDKLLLGIIALVALFLNKRVLIPSAELLTTIKDIHLALITHAITFRHEESWLEIVGSDASRNKRKVDERNKYADDIAIQFRELSAKLEYFKRVILWYPLAKLFFGLPKKDGLDKARKSLIGYSNNMEFNKKDQSRRYKKEVIIRESLELLPQD